MDFDLILSNCRLISKNCDFLKLRDLETIVSAYGHKWCCTRVYLQWSKRNCVWKTLKVIEASQVICLISSILNHHCFWNLLRLTIVIKAWLFGNEVLILLSMACEFHFECKSGGDERWRLRLSFRWPWLWVWVNQVRIEFSNIYFV